MGFCYKKQVRVEAFPWRTRNVNGNSEFGERKAIVVAVVEKKEEVVVKKV